MSARSVTARVCLFASALTLLSLGAASVAEAQRGRHAHAQHDRARVRFGINGAGGGFVGAAHGGLGGLGLRVGVQVNDVFGVYIQGHGLLGQFLPDPGDRLAGFALHSLMFDVTLADRVQLGLGPALDFVWGCDGRFQPSCTESGPYLGGNARVAFIAGGRDRGHRRSGLVFSLDVHPTWFGGDHAAVALLAGIGYELF